MVTKTRAQIHMDETIVENPELEKMLEDRQELKNSVSAYSKLNKDVKGRLSAIEMPTPFRIGRFVINRTAMAGREVAFETSDGVRFSIKLAGEE